MRNVWTCAYASANVLAEPREALTVKVIVRVGPIGATMMAYDTISLWNCLCLGWYLAVHHTM